jgi:hypothetical protein
MSKKQVRSCGAKEGKLIITVSENLGDDNFSLHGLSEKYKEFPDAAIASYAEHYNSDVIVTYSREETDEEQKSVLFWKLLKMLKSK